MRGCQRDDQSGSGLNGLECWGAGSRAGSQVVDWWLKWRHISARGAKVDQIFVDDSIEAFFLDDLDWTKRGFRNVALDLLTVIERHPPNLKFIWAAVCMSKT
jgi:hypothetical protein